MANITITWTAEDVLTLREEWTIEQAGDALDQIGNQLRDRSIETGWGIMEILLDTLLISKTCHYCQKPQTEWLGRENCTERKQGPCLYDMGNGSLSQ